MRKIIGLIICLTVFSQTVFARENNLQLVFDEYFYSMNVEWDQQNVDFVESQKELLIQRIVTLKKEGLSNDDLLVFLSEKLQINSNELLLEARMQNFENGEALSEFLIVKMAGSYSQGANWSGSLKPVAIGAIVLVLAYLGAMVIDQSIRDSRAWGRCREIHPGNPSTCYYYDPFENYRDPAPQWNIIGL